jgi:hypothetical protein
MNFIYKFNKQFSSPLEFTIIEIGQNDIELFSWLPANHIISYRDVFLPVKTYLRRKYLVIVKMIAIRCCANPKPETPAIKLPKRLARARRVVESKRMDSFRQFHESLKKTAKDEQDFIKDLFDKLQDREIMNDVDEDFNE